jgi:aminopeptidase N
MPIPPYCMIIGVGQFNRQEPQRSLITPLSYYVPGSDAAAAQKGFAPANSVLEYFSQTVGPYPYEKLALIVGNTRYGGMENSGAIVFTSSLFSANFSDQLSQDSTISVVAHEIAHQWFGDSVTESTWSDLWLSEGFATYFAGLFIQRTLGQVAFQRYMKQAATTVLAYEQKSDAPIFDRDTEDLMKLLNPNNYQKGAWVLHMLRSQLGDEAFFQGIKTYYAAYKNANAGTEDLRAALEKASGKNLNQFFTRWIYKSGHPKYDMTTRWDNKRGELTIRLDQVQPGEAFLDPVPVRLQSMEGITDISINPQGKSTNKTVRLKSKPTSIQIDPANTLLKEVNKVG